MKITEDILYIGVNDRDIRLFEGQYKVEHGMSYNSYLIKDEKNTVIDTVDGRFTGQWLDALDGALSGDTPDYLVVEHMEPDHSAGIAAFCEKYPQAQIVASAKAFVMMKNFFGREYGGITVKDNDTLSTGSHTLRFIAAPMVHWPEVMTVYDEREGIFFSADGFGKFGTTDTDEDWACEARRYYFGIVGKYGAQVQALLKKAAGLDIKIICPLHGPVLKESLEYYINLYDIWSSYRPESEGVNIAYASVYGGTERAALMLADKLRAMGCNTAVNDLTRCDIAEAVEDAFRYDRTVLASVTYNGEVFPCMREYINHLVERGFKNRTVALIENGSWAPMAAKTMKAMLDGCKDIKFTDNAVKITSAPDAQTEAAVDTLAHELCNSI